MNIHLIQGKNNLQLPILPSEYTLSSSQNNTSENVSTLGEVNILGKRNLKTITIESMFPAHQYSFNKYKKIKKPSQCVAMVESMKQKGVVRFIMTGSKNINMLCTIEEFEWGENDASHDINFSMNLKEYRMASGKRSSKKNTIKAVIHIVKKGETLKKIAKKETGDSKNWKQIKKQNHLKSNKLKKGQKLVIKL